MSFITGGFCMKKDGFLLLCIYADDPYISVLRDG